MSKSISRIPIIALMFISLFVNAQESEMKIKITKNDFVIEMILDNNESAKSLFDQLPLKLKIEDYASNEKIFYPPKKLSVVGAPSGHEPKVGEITKGLENLKNISNGEVRVEKIE